MVMLWAFKTFIERVIMNLELVNFNDREVLKTDLVTLGDNIGSIIKESSDKAGDIIIEDSGGEEEGLILIKNIMGNKKLLETRRKEYVSPFNGIVKQINAFVGGYSERFGNAENVIRGKVMKYKQDQAEKLRVAEEDRKKKVQDLQETARVIEGMGYKTTEAFNTEKLTEINEASAKVEELKTESPKTFESGRGASVKKLWDFEVTNIHLIPREYMAPDMKKIREAVTKDSVREITGVRIFPKESLSVR